ncbi:MAG: hypothetical protein KFB93_05590 [Simkaniaceae bacterium]|nr:MAG: hypothetical protein KFB93_05590 [Simkaniaceae bacterium]
MMSVFALGHYRGEDSKAYLEGRGPSMLEMEPLLLKSDQLGQYVIPSSPKEVKETSKTCEFVYLGSDVFGVPRLVGSLVNTIQGRPDPAGFHGMGLTSIFSVYTGYVAGQRGLDKYTEASKVGDSTGQALGAINIARGPMEAMGGLTFTPFRALSIAATYTSAKSVTIAATTLGIVGSAFYSITYILLAIPSIVSLTKNIQFGRKLHQAMDQEQEPTRKAQVGLKALMVELDGTTEEKVEFLKGVAEDPAIWDGEEVRDPGQTDHRQYTLEEKRLLWYEAEKYTSDDYSKELLYGHFKKRYCEFKAKKEAQFARKTGADSVDLIRTELNKSPRKTLVAQLEKGKGLEEAQGVIDSIKGEMTKNKVLHAAIIFFCVVGVFALVAGTVASGGALGIAIAVAWVVSAIGMLAIDGYFLYKTLQSGNMDKKDKIAFFVANALLILIAGAGMFFSGGLAPIIIGAVMFALWSGVAGYSIYQWKINKIEDETAEAPYRGAAQVNMLRKKKLV